jgi:hypothetical protein
MPTLEDGPKGRPAVNAPLLAELGFPRPRGREGRGAQRSHPPLARQAALWETSPSPGPERLSGRGESPLSAALELIHG